MADRTIINNSFQYGIVGNRITGKRESEIYQYSARGLNNFLITDIGTLKVAKQFEEIELNISGIIKNVVDTANDYYLILTDISLYSVTKEDNTIQNSIAHNMESNVDLQIIGKDMVVLFDNQNKMKVFSIDGELTSSDDIELSYPIKDKKTLTLDLWRISTDPIDSTELRCVKMSSSSDPLIKSEGDKIYLHNSSVVIDRIYVSYNGIVDADTFNEPKDGDTYGILKTFYKVEDKKKYIIDNTSIEIGELTNDEVYDGMYFTSVVGEGDGIFSFGESVTSIEYPESVGYFQNRMVIYKNGYFYFSKIRDYEDFRNDNPDDSAFFIAHNPINNKFGSFLGFISSNGLYAITTTGIIVIGYNYQLTPSSSTLSTIATDMSVQDNYEMVDKNLYFTNNNGVLKSLQLDRSSQQLAFSVYTVDKYSTKQLFKNITKTIINDNEYIVAQSLDNNSMYLIESLDDGDIFRKVKLDFEYTDKIFGLNDRLIMGNKVYTVGDNNYKLAELIMNPPALNGNDILMDNNSSIKDVIIKLENEDRLAVEGVRINNKPLSNLPSTVEDLFNIYRYRTSFKVKNGFSIQIQTNENNKTCELSIVQMLVNPIKDN